MSDPNPASKRETKVERIKDLLQFQSKSVVSRMMVKNGGGSVTQPSHAVQDAAGDDSRR